MAAGCFGKIPATGDFVRFGLPPGFVTAWDGWLSDQMVAAARLGLPWSEIYLAAPVWCFALADGLAGAGPVRGVTVPSVDAHGRCFPLTVAEIVTNATPVGLRQEGRWFKAAETLAREALDAVLPPVRLKDRLADLPSPPVSAPSPCTRLALADDAGCETRISRLAERIALFWTNGSPRVAPSILLCRALPEAAQAVAMYDGEWERHGWSTG